MGNAEQGGRGELPLDGTLHFRVRLNIHTTGGLVLSNHQTPARMQSQYFLPG